MVYGLPTRGQADWDDELNNSVEALKAGVDEAVADANNAVSTANAAAVTASQAAADVADLQANAAVLSVNGLAGDVVLGYADVGAAAATHDHDTRYYTKSATDSLLTSNATDDRARANHTGTQPSSTISDFTEAVQDAVASLLQAGTGVTMTYDDNLNQLTISGASGSGLDAEGVRDAIGVALIGSGLISVTVNDAADTITIATSATANDTNANLRDRATHTGTQTLASISDAGTAASKDVGTAAGTVAAGDDSRITGAAQKSQNLADLSSASTARTNLGLGNVDNTSDATKNAASVTLTNKTIDSASNTITLATSTLTSGTLPVARGGTNSTSTPTAGAVAVGDGSKIVYSAAGTSGQVLLSGGTGVPTWSTLSVPTYKVQSVTQTYSASATPTDSNTLTCDVPATGVYVVCLEGMWSTNVTSNGINARFAYTGTQTTASGYYRVGNADLNYTAWATPFTTATMSPNGVVGVGQEIAIRMVFTATSTGTLTFQFAPETAGTGTVGILPGTVMQVHRI